MLGNSGLIYMGAVSLKKKLLITLIFTFIIVFGVVMISSKENSTSRHDNEDEMEVLLDSEDKTLEKAENSKDNQEVFSVESKYACDDLVYREYTWGYCLEKGYEIFIESNQITREAENVQNIVIILNNNIYKQYSFDNDDIEFTLEKSGNYAFLAIDSDGNSVDITSIVKVNKSADGGIIFLN